ncbi:Hsp20/alpha crystallin family protein [Formosa maritima]|uniref:Hsp20/alpha crystallin family protein n=1 Tax=Formosa maritima TaxID=2592046 RepID=A0A5D0GJM3_9FLAO|nr:Hsp20/alpha crystallin family protein [Formosa maritima]TYA59000.1 Hsp20/alpha crystallin family protein [Formosa maritima]
MSTLVKVPKNGGLPNTISNVNFPSFSNWIEDIFKSDLPNVFPSSFNTGMSLPKVNIKEKSDSFVVEMAIPGIKKSDLQIDIDNNNLCISSETKEETEQKEDNYTRKEFGYSSFKRTFTLPESVDDSKIDAVYFDGILNITLPKKEEAKKKPIRTIKVT